MQIPGKTVRLVNMITQHTKAKIKLNNEYTEQIDVKTGIKQGDTLSTILFSTVIESLMRKLEIFCILLSMLHHPEVILHTIMCLAIRSCLWVGGAGSACAVGGRHGIPITTFILQLVFLWTCSLHLHHYSLS